MLLHRNEALVALHICFLSPAKKASGRTAARNIPYLIKGRTASPGRSIIPAGPVPHYSPAIFLPQAKRSIKHGMPCPYKSSQKGSQIEIFVDRFQLKTLWIKV